MDGKDGVVPEPDVMDVFDNLLGHEERSREAGLSEGNYAGEVNGYVEGFGFGWNKGWEIITEMGFYKGYAVRSRDHLSHLSPTSESILRKQQAITLLLDVISRVSFEDIKNGTTSDDIILARRKFKQVFPTVLSLKGAADNDASF